MLDHEPDNTSDTTPDSATPPTAPAPRRRRAATRPAGPPVQAPAAAAEPAATDPAAEPAEAPTASSEEPAPRAKRAPRKATKKAAASEGTGDEEVTPPPTRRRRKAAEPEPVVAVEAPAEPEVAQPEAGPPVTEPVLESANPVDDNAVEPEPVGAEPEPEPEPVEGPTPEAEAHETPGAETAETAEAAEGAEAAETDDEDEEGGGRRRRRRRGGRRRRRGGSDQSSDTESDEDEGETEDPSTGSEGAGAAEAPRGDDSTDSEEASDSGEGEGGRRRRRRRRRRGEETGALPDDPSDVVVRVREPRPSRRSEEVSGIDGSTRMEAKRQRRREGREAGRRRAPILSEAEFLARRESVARKMVIRQREDLTQIAVLEDDILVEHYVDRDSAASLIGNVYLGRVQNVLPSMEAAFIDIGRGRNAVLYAGEVDWASLGGDGQQRKIESVLKSGSTVLVQVTKDPVGAKGARLTNHVSIPGRYIVYAPGGHLSGISRKLPDVERKRLKTILSDLVPESASVIVRTAAEGASEDELVRDVNRLKAQWEDIERKVKTGSAPQLLYSEPDLTLRIIRDLFTEDFGELIIQGNGSMTDAYDAVDAYVGHIAPHLKDRLRHWDAEADGDLFGAYRLDEHIAKGLERKVFLPSGGSLVIDRTEAMTVIDVNTGKFTGSGGNLEATVTSNNLEAAEEIVRQLRLRDIGGIIVIDFIDMVLPSNRELLLRRLVECLGRDRTRHQVAEVTSLGLVQLTRKRIGTGLLEAFSTECPHCGGRGYEIHDLPVETQKQPDGGIRESRQRDRSRDGGKREKSAKKKDPAEPVADVALATASG